LRAVMMAQAAALRSPLEALVVTSPHYLPLVRLMRRKVPVFYYCSDDYSGYDGWGGDALLRREGRLVRSVTHSFFVSRPLADRATADYGAAPDAVSVCPNATDASFLREVPAAEIDRLLDGFPSLRRPLLGVVGGVNDRLDFHLLRQCADLPRTGSLVFVGGVDPACDDADLRALQAHPKVVFTGARPHGELPVWMQALDAALIPYRPTPLNHACSPMRLYDHLAAGRPIVATTACAQVCDFPDWVRACRTPAAFVQELDHVLAHAPGSAPAMRDFTHQAHLWSHRADHLASHILPSQKSEPTA
jgi:glycosyltransferase involved in cell wall biosynthesis